MTSINPAETFKGHLSLLTLWPLILLTPLLPFPAPSILVGHPWKPELFLSLLLIGVFAVIFLKANGKFGLNLTYPITAAMAAFVIWSGVSILWAGSLNSVFHHTLVWAEYLIFFVILSSSITGKHLFRNTIYVLGVVALIISANCVIEYVLRERIDSTFGFRYGRFSEVWAALIPLFTAFTIRTKGMKLGLSIVVTSLMWLAVLFSTSRTSLAAAAGGLAVFVLSSLLLKKGRGQFKKLVFVVSLLAIIGVVTQLPIFPARDEQKPSVLNRIATSSETDPSNSLGRNIRFLFIGVGAEMVRSNPLGGVGADNFGVAFNKYRSEISASSEKGALVTGNEDAIPERAHNEYLQVATELGIIGLGLFGVFLIAVFWLGYRSLKQSVNIYKLAAASGITAFLFSSLFSSYSFRLVQNGVVFFFLAAILIGKQRAQRSKNSSLLAVALAASVCLGVFSSLKAASQYMAYRGESTADLGTALSDLSTAEKLDSTNAAANYTAALKLLNESRYAEAAAHFQAAIDKGVGTSATYSYLISAHSLNGSDQSALDSAAAAVRVFPYSTFLLTRYSVLLEKAGNTSEAQKQFSRAQGIDARQAETWKMFIINGARVAAEAGRNGVGVPLMADLYPQDALYAMLAERQILHPNERYTFLGQ